MDHLRDQSSGEIYWFNTDLNGAPLEVTDERGAVRWSGQYGSFGEVRHQSEGFSRVVNRTAMAHQPLRYAWQYADGETGLHYNLFRYYDPQVGRFIVQDPIGLNGGWNLYQYAPNPLIWIDPLGLDVIRLRHYTSNQGFTGIKNSMVIKAGDQNAVFATRAKGKPLSIADAAEKFKIKQNHARNYIDFDIDESRVEFRKNDLGVEEYKIKGDVVLDKNTTKFNKRC